MPTTLRGAILKTRAEHLTPERARTFVLMLTAGIPPYLALAYFGPAYFATLSKKGRKAWLSAWSGDPLVVTAMNDYQGGEWHLLDHDKRIEIATNKHTSELAYYLYRNNFVSTTDDLTLAKMKAAREALSVILKGGDDERRSKEFSDIVRDIVDGKEGFLKPPQLEKDTPDEH